jgi:hypothetical protein
MIPLPIFNYTSESRRIPAISPVEVFYGVIGRCIPLITQFSRDLRQMDMLLTVGTAGTHIRNDHSWFTASRQNLWIGGQRRHSAQRCCSA